MDYLTAAIAWMFWTLLSVVTWVLSYLFWIFVWLVLPLVIVAFVAVRIAERVLGQEVVRGWVKAKSMKYGAGAWARARRLLFALGVLPVRVLFWFALYAVWHSLISLFWRPRWKPWARAWSKRWRPQVRA
jgi:hypothetical protein